MKSLLDILTDRYAASLLEAEARIREGAVMTAGPPAYRRLDCDGRALAYIRKRPRKAAVRVDLSGLWVIPGRASVQVPSAAGAALLLRSTRDVEEAVAFTLRAVATTRELERRRPFGSEYPALVASM